MNKNTRQFPVSNICLKMFSKQIIHADSHSSLNCPYQWSCSSWYWRSAAQLQRMLRKHSGKRWGCCSKALSTERIELTSFVLVSSSLAAERFSLCFCYSVVLSRAAAYTRFKVVPAPGFEAFTNKAGGLLLAAPHRHESSHARALTVCTMKTGPPFWKVDYFWHRAHCALLTRF